jgi:hypothetical protein
VVGMFVFQQSIWNVDCLFRLVLVWSSSSSVLHDKVNTTGSRHFLGRVKVEIQIQ